MISNLRWLHLAFVAALVFPTLLFLGAAWFDRNQLLDQALADARSTAFILREHALKVLETNEQLIQEVDWRIRDMTWDEIRGRRDPLAAQIRTMIGNLSEISAIGLTDVAGTEWVETTMAGTQQPPAGIDVSTREFSGGQRDADRGTLITHTYFDDRTQQESFAISRRRSTRDSSYDGTVHAAMAVSYFTDFWEDAMQGRHGAWVALVRADGNILAQTPALAAPTSQLLLADSPLVQQIALEPEGGVYTAVSSIDGHACIFASLKVGNYPVMVVYRLELGAALAPFYQHLVVLAGVCGFAAAALAGSVLLAVRQGGRLALEQTRRVAAEHTAIEAQRLEVLGQLAAGVAHDFSNVVQAVEMGAMIIAAGKADERTLKAARMIGDAARQGRWLTRRMLDIARGEEADETHSAVHVGEAVAGVSKLLSTTLGAGYRVRYEVRSEGFPTLVRGDRNALEGAIMNLAINARDAMPNGGEVVIRLGSEQVVRNGGGGSGAAGLTPGLYARVAVADAGGGMAADVLARVGEPFFTTKPRGQGTGLGLAAARGFARRAGGGFQVDSKQGVGTTVSLWLPEVVADQAGVQPCLEDAVV